MNKEDVFIFTEAYNCGLILKNALDTFHKYHDAKVNIFGTYKDFKQLTKHKNNVYIEMTEDDSLRNLYTKGHLGTAYIFARVINGDYTKCKKIIHFDSDIIFRNECLSLILNGFDEGYDLIGSRRCYKNNLNGIKNLDNIQDVVQTYFFGFNVDKMNKYTFDELVRMCVGYYNPYNHFILDFFDPVSFDILYNDGKPLFLDRELVGGMNELGDKNNKYGEVNQKIDFGDYVIHFAGVGSGMNFFKNGGETAQSYKDWAIKQYILYYKLFYGAELSDNYDKEKYEIIEKFIKNNH